MRRLLVIMCVCVGLAACGGEAEPESAALPTAPIASEPPLNDAQVRTVLSGLMPAASALPSTLSLVAEEYQDEADAARQGPFVTFDLAAARWRADLDRVYLADAAGAEPSGPDRVTGGLLAVQLSASYFDDAAGAQAAMRVLQAASIDELAALPGGDIAPTSLREVTLTVGEASRAIVFSVKAEALGQPQPVWTEVVALQRGRVLAAVIVFADAPVEEVTGTIARALDAGIGDALVALPPAEPEPVDPDRAAASDALDQAVARWQAAGLDAYDFRFVRYCECPEAYAGPFDVRVSAGRPAAIELRGQPGDPAAATTVDALFEDIGAAIERGVRVSVTYDPDLGYPLAVRLDLDAIAADGGLALDVLSLTP